MFGGADVMLDDGGPRVMLEDGTPKAGNRDEREVKGRAAEARALGAGLAEVGPSRALVTSWN